MFIFSFTLSACSKSSKFTEDSSLESLTFNVLDDSSSVLNIVPNFVDKSLSFSLRTFDTEDQGDLSGEMYDKLEEVFADFTCSDFDPSEHSGSDFIVSAVFAEESCNFSFSFDEENEKVSEFMNFYSEFLNYVTSDKF